MKTRKRFFAAVVAVIAATATVSAAAPPGIPAPGAAALARAIREIRAQEHAVHNITVSASSTIYGQQYDPKTKKWVWSNLPLNKDTLTATFDGTPRGLFRADVHKQWVAGNYGHPAQFVVDSFIVAYNGRIGTYLKTAVASVGSAKLFAYNQGRIDAKMPMDWYTAAGSTAWTCTIFGFTGFSPPYYCVPFSRFISPGQKRVSLTARWTQWKGSRYLQVTRTGPPLGKDVLLLDPRRAYSIIQCDHYGWIAKRNPAGHLKFTTAPKPTGQFRVHGFFEPARGVFYPRKVVWLAVGPDGKKFASGEEIVTKVIVNDPHVNASTYVVRFPRGALIQDKSTGRYIQVGGTPEQQLKEIEAAVKAAR